MRTVFVKSSCQYAEEFCALTSIVEDGQGERFVRKQPLSPRSAEHIRNMYLSSQELPEILDKVDICDCRMEGDSVLFPYHVGASCYEHILRQSRLSPEKGLRAWEEMLALLEPKTGAEVPFHDSEAFRALFGDGRAFEYKGEKAYPYVAFDLTPANILLRDGKAPVLIDYEWRIAAPVPVALVKYHAVKTTYAYKEMCTFGPPLEDVLQLVGMTAPEGCYQQAMDHFFLTIFGELSNRTPYGKMVRERYQRPYQRSMSSLLLDKEKQVSYLELQNQQVQQQWKSDAAQWQAQSKEKDEYIDYLESQNRAIDEQWKSDAAQWEEQTKGKDKYIAYLESRNQSIEEQWKSDASQWREQKDGLEGQIIYLESQSRVVERQWQKDVAQWQAEKDRLSGELSEREAAYEQVVHSLSWRLTKPLRSIDAVVGRLFRKK